MIIYCNDPGMNEAAFQGMLCQGFVAVAQVEIVELTCKRCCAEENYSYICS